MLSSFLGFMKRERTLSFSAALCVLTLSAAVMPGVFQEDDPFENTNLWENADSAESFDVVPEAELEFGPAPEDPKAVASQNPSRANRTEAQPNDVGEFDAFENAPDLELRPEPDADEKLESFANEQAPQDLEMPQQVELEPLELAKPPVEPLEVSLEAPMLESEIVESESSSEVESEFSPQDQIDVNEPESSVLQFSESDADDDLLPNDVATEIPSESNSTQPELGILEPTDEGDAGLDSNQAATQDSDQDLQLAPPAASDERVFQGEWVPPLTPEVAPNLTPELAVEPAVPGKDDGLLTLPGAPQPLDADLSNEPPVFEPLPAQPFPEFDWSQTDPRSFQIDRGIRTNQGTTPTEPAIPLGSPQLLSNGYQPFAAGNPALGGSVELNPMRELPLPGELIWTENQDFVLDLPNAQSIDQGTPSFTQSVMEPEPNQLSEFSVEPVQNPNQIGAYEPIFNTPEVYGEGKDIQATLSEVPYEIPEVSSYGWAVSHPMLRSAPGRCRLLNRLATSLSRLKVFKLRSFNLCPAKRTAACKQQVAHGGMTRGLLKNWFHRAPVRRKAAGLTGWLFSEPSCYPCRGAACGLTNWLLSPPNHRPVQNTARWLMQPPTFKPLQGLRGCLFKKRCGPPTRGLLSRFYRSDNTNS